MSPARQPASQPAAPSTGEAVPKSNKLESLLWAAAGAAVVLYGSGERNLLSVLALDGRLNRVFVWLGAINVWLNALLFLYVYGWLGGVRRVQDPVRSGTLAVPAGAVTFVTMFVSFIVALWPVFGILSIAQVTVVAYGCVSALAFLPGMGPLRVNGRADKDD